jgi:hypothetical protein
MELSSKETVFCEGCRREALLLRTVDGAQLCVGCVEKSDRIDQQLATVRSDDPVDCDSCGDRVEFDARVAVVARECGGAVFCGDCKLIISNERATA